MTIGLQLESQPDARAAGAVARRREPLPRLATLPDRKAQTGLSRGELAFRVFAGLRAHPHINNVLTHVCRARWPELEHSLNVILDPTTTSDRLSPLAQNVLELIAADRGVTGKMAKPYFHAILNRLLEQARAERLIRHVEALYAELEWKLQHPAPSTPTERSKEKSHD